MSAKSVPEGTNAGDGSGVPEKPVPPPAVEQETVREKQLRAELDKANERLKFYNGMATRLKDYVIGAHGPEECSRFQEALKTGKGRIIETWLDYISSLWRENDRLKMEVDSVKEKEPSGRNALNLQTALEALKKAGRALRDFAIVYRINPEHGNYFLCQICEAESKDSDMALVHASHCTFAAVTGVLDSLSPDAPESDSVSEFTKSDELLTKLDDLYKRYQELGRVATWGGSYERESSAAMQLKPVVNTMFDTLLQLMAARKASSPSSPLLEGEEDSAPKAQPQSERTKDTTGQATSI